MTDLVTALLEQRADQGFAAPSESVAEALAEVIASVDRRGAT